MKKVFIRAISLILIVSLCISVLAVSISATDTKLEIPVIYVGGQGQEIVIYDGDEIKERIYPISLSDDEIKGIVERNIGKYVKAVITNVWDGFCDSMYDEIMQILGPMKLDKNGKAPNGSKAEFHWDDKKIENKLTSDGYYVRQFRFSYDWRVDPYETAEILHKYIEDVLRITGEEKVSISGRCLGANIIAAYMEKYDGEYVEDVCFYAAALNGATIANMLFTADLELQQDAIERYVYDWSGLEDKDLTQFLKSLTTALVDLFATKALIANTNRVYKEMYTKIMPRVMRDTYASFPGFWSMVSDRNYEEAKANIFRDDTTGEYDSFIKIIDNYHYTVQTKLEENIRKFEKRGIEFSNIAKYGFQTVPLTKESKFISDACCPLFDSSFGATAGLFGETFSDEYIKTAIAEGRGEYISPDKQVDASTCILKDRTWIIKNMEHREFPECIDRLQAAIFANDGFNVNSDPEYPRFMMYDIEKEVVFPMTAENCGSEKKYEISYFQAIFRLAESLIRIIAKNTKK